jgi:DNA-binding LacI/PurR family transcriptional regulator
MIWLDAPSETHDNRVASLRGWERLFQAAEIPFRSDWIVGISSVDATIGGDAFDYLWDQPKRPRGLIIADDVIAHSVRMSTMAARVRVPDELCITTMLNRGSPIAFPPSWAQWEHDPHETARQAVNAITRMNRGESVSDTIAMTLRQVFPAARDQGRPAPAQSFTIAREILEAAC